MNNIVSQVEEIHKLEIAARINIRTMLPILDILDRRKEFAKEMLYNRNNIKEEDVSNYYKMLNSFNKDIKQLLGL